MRHDVLLLYISIYMGAVVFRAFYMIMRHDVLLLYIYTHKLYVYVWGGQLFFPFFYMLTRHDVLLLEDSIYRHLTTKFCKPFVCTKDDEAKI
jgi:hypothetical protein